MDWVVLEFSGESVACAPRWAALERAVREVLADNLRAMVVCPALLGVPQAIERAVAAARAGEEVDLRVVAAPHYLLAADLRLHLPEGWHSALAQLRRELERVRRSKAAGPWVHARGLAAGEAMGARLAEAWLRSRGLQVSGIDARELLQAEEGPAPLQARPAQRLVQVSGGPEVLVTQGRVAVGRGGNTVLLGQSGSGLAGAMLGGQLRAVRVERWTDRLGLHAADPLRHPRARLLPQLGYEEAAALGWLGGGEPEPRAVELLRRRGIPLHLRSTLRPEVAGTRIGPGSGAGPQAVCVRRGLVLLRLPGARVQAGALAPVLDRLDRRGVAIDLLACSPSQVALTLDPARCPGADLPRLLGELRRECAIQLEFGVASVSLVGTALGATCGGLAPLADAVPVHFVAHDPADHYRSWVLHESQAQPLAERLHMALAAGRSPREEGVSAPVEAMGA